MHHLLQNVAELEQVTHHDVVALLAQFLKALDLKRSGSLRSYFLLTLLILLKDFYLSVDNIIRKDLHELKETIAEKARKYKYTVEMGRTHGVQAEPTTFGLKLARWHAEINRDIERFEHAAKG